MDRREVIERLEGLCAAARARFPPHAAVTGMFYVFAEVLWMDDRELHEFHYLKSLLPDPAEEIRAARLRLAYRYTNLRIWP